MTPKTHKFQFCRAYQTHGVLFPSIQKWSNIFIRDHNRNSPPLMNIYRLLRTIFKCCDTMACTCACKLCSRAPKQFKKTVSLPMQTGHIGSSVDPTGGVAAISVDGVYCTAAINRTWQTSPYAMEQEVIRRTTQLSNSFILWWSASKTKVQKIQN